MSQRSHHRLRCRDRLGARYQILLLYYVIATKLGTAYSPTADQRKISRLTFLCTSPFFFFFFPVRNSLKCCGKDYGWTNGITLSGSREWALCSWQHVLVLPTTPSEVRTVLHATKGAPILNFADTAFQKFTYDTVWWHQVTQPVQSFE